MELSIEEEREPNLLKRYDPPPSEFADFTQGLEAAGGGDATAVVEPNEMRELLGLLQRDTDGSEVSSVVDETDSEVQAQFEMMYGNNQFYYRQKHTGKRYKMLSKYITCMNRREYLVHTATVGGVGVSGCIDLGGTTYTAEAGEYILSFDEITNILSGSFSGREVGLEDEKSESGRGYEFERGSLAAYALRVADSVDDGEVLYQNFVSTVESIGTSQGEEMDIGDKAIYDEFQGSGALGVRLGNIMFNMNGSASLLEMQSLSESQINKIRDIG